MDFNAMNANDLSRLEIESMIFGIVKTLEMIHSNAKSGSITPEKYNSYVLQSISQIQELSEIISAKGLSFNDMLNEMNLSESLYGIISWIKGAILSGRSNSVQSISGSPNPSDLSDYSGAFGSFDSSNYSGTPDRNRNQQPPRPSNQTEYTLNTPNPIIPAKLSAQITADFITILDYFRLGLNDLSILQTQFIHLYENLGKFPNMEEIAVELSMMIKQIYSNDTPHHSNQNIQMKNIPIKVEQLYKEFKTILFKLSWLNFIY